MRDFFWGVSIDDVWSYTENRRPEHELAKVAEEIRIPRGKIELFRHPSYKELLRNASYQTEDTEKKVEENCDFLVKSLKGSGIEFVRCWFPWNFFQEKADSQMKYTMDTFVSRLEQGSIKIIGVIGNGYRRFIPKGINVESIKSYVENLVESCTKIISHYRNIKLWQIENEPNWWKEHLIAGWRSGFIWLEPDVEEKILKPLYDIVREERPDAEIMINLEIDRGIPNLERYKKYCDVIGLDAYPSYAHPHNTSAEELSVASQVKRATGLKVIVAETGYPSGPEIFGYTEDRQAEYICSACKNSYSCDGLSGMIVWRFSDSDWNSFPPQENHFGLFTKERKPKKSWIAYREYTKSPS